MTDALTEKERAAVAALDRAIGTVRAAKALEISRTSLLSVLAGKGVRKGTVSLIRTNLPVQEVDVAPSNGETRHESDPPS